MTNAAGMTNAEGLAAVVAVLVSLSVASERLVEIVKGLIPWLNTAKKKNPTQEGWRKAVLQSLAVVSGVATANLAAPAIQPVLPELWGSRAGILALGLLASGGSGFWNTVLTYVLNVKELKKEEVEKLRKDG